MGVSDPEPINDQTCRYPEIMHPRIWGRDMWRTIHFVALGYPVREPDPETIKAYQAYFQVMGSVLPCARCSVHYAEYISTHPVGPSLNARSDLFRWTVDLHNDVNINLGREVWTYEHAYEVYSDRRFSTGGGINTGDEARLVIRRLATVILSLIVVISVAVLWRRRLK